jgi:hypothetical protein
MEHTAYSLKKELNFSSPVDQKSIMERVQTFLLDLKLCLKNSGCQLIGHIKGIVDANEQGFLAFSITSFDEDVHYKGEINGRIKYATFLLNVIVYGVDQESIEKEVLYRLQVISI